MIEIRFALRAIYPELLNIHRQYSAGGAISDAFNIQVLTGPLLRLFFLCVCRLQLFRPGSRVFGPLFAAT